MQVRGGDDSQGSFMKFTFLQTPEAQVHGPVLQSRVFAFRCLQSNTACIILGSILPSPLPPAGHRIAYDCGLEPLSAPPMTAVTVPSSLSITPVNGGRAGRQHLAPSQPMQPQPPPQVPQQPPPQVMPPAASMPMFDEEPSEAALAQPFAPHPLRGQHQQQTVPPPMPISGTSTNVSQVKIKASKPVLRRI